MCFDTYSKTSLKYQELLQRGENEEEFLLSGPEQKPVKSFEVLLKNSSFKNELCKFLRNEWQKPEYRTYLGGKILYVSYGGSCVRIEEGTMEPENLQGIHAEADTLIALHSFHSKGDVVIRATDTDVLIILLSMIAKHNDNETPIAYNRITMDAGVGNNRHYVNFSQVYQTYRHNHPDSQQHYVVYIASQGAITLGPFLVKEK